MKIDIFLYLYEDGSILPYKIYMFRILDYFEVVMIVIYLL